MTWYLCLCVCGCPGTVPDPKKFVCSFCATLWRGNDRGHCPPVVAQALEIRGHGVPS
ncbi:hypothetical protein LCGC14_1089300 [marine sediment metagenome]|uniref:Uncharacterized protein n=1 Tax=marine sediment metagenome TaxID=412755 RepID=A0A0F9N0H9_9ZZZZ